MNTEKQLISLINATKALTSTRNLDEVLSLLIKEVLSVFDWADASVLFLYDHQKKHLMAKAAVGFDMDYMKEVALKPNEGMSGKTFQLKQAQLFTSGSDTLRGMSDLSPINMEFYQKSLGERHRLPTSTICAPLITQGECFGVLTIDSFSESVQFTHENLMLLQTFANQAMIAIENATLISQNNRANHIHRELTKVYMSHQGLDEITKTLSQLICKPVGVWNEFFDLLSFTKEAVKKVSETLTEKEDLGHGKPVQKQVHIEGADYDVYFFPVKIEKDLTGILLVVAEKEEVLHSLDIFAIEQATTVFALELQSLNRHLSSQFNYDGSLLKEILQQPDQGTRVLKKNKLYRKNARYVMVTLEVSEERFSHSDEHQIKLGFSRQLHRQLSTFAYKSLVYEQAMQYSILLIANESLREDDLHLRLGVLVSKLKERSRLALFAGVGRSFTDMAEIHVSLKDSVKCIEYLKQTHAVPGEMATYQDLGAYRLFLNVDHQELESFSKMKLQKILSYDRENSSELAHTLEWYLLLNQNTRKTAEKMFVHDNTIKYRVNSIKKILEVDELTGELGFDLLLAMKIRKYLDKSLLSD